IRLDDTEDEETFASYPVNHLASLTDTQVVDNLVVSGLWVALRARP
ncbi:MAG TPA: NADH:ubiquinone reductase (Na(+)-transporting) subunit A, partial [Nitrospira sp.]|nr:NADH:ubiquinone reductase (Na(+)-transporting) subunit A [Nitrospira sp.]